MIVGIPRGMSNAEFEALGDELFDTALEAYSQQLSAKPGYPHRFAERTLNWHLDRLALWLIAWETDLGNARDYAFEQAFDDAYEWVRSRNAKSFYQMVRASKDV